MTIDRGLISVRSLLGVLSAAASAVTEDCPGQRPSSRRRIDAEHGIAVTSQPHIDKTPDLEVRLKLANIRGHFSQSGQGGKHDSNATIGIWAMDCRC